MRIHFTLTDLARTRLAATPSPLAITALSVYQLHIRADSTHLEMWRRSVRAGLGGAGRSPFGELAPGRPYDPVPRFLRPPVGSSCLDEELEHILATPARVMREDLAYVAQHRPLPSWARDLADADRETAVRFAASVRAYHEVAVAPYWRSLTLLLAADRAERTRQLEAGGIERLLETIVPHARWRPPVLELPSPDEDHDHDYHLGGRGLVIAPGAFTSYAPCDPGDEQPTLYYRLPDGPGTPGFVDRLGGPYGGLAALLGHSRAAVLEVVADGASTGQLARRTGLSAASASEHTGVLRRAGLVATRRTGRTTHHTLTPLGARLLLHAATPPGH